MTEQTFWNGEPVNAARGTAVIADAPEFPLYWAKHLIGQRIRVVRVFYHGQKIDLYDEDGSAWRKITEGKGSPRYMSSSIKLEPDSLHPDDWGPLLQEVADREGLTLPKDASEGGL